MNSKKWYRLGNILAIPTVACGIYLMTLLVSMVCLRNRYNLWNQRDHCLKVGTAVTPIIVIFIKGDRAQKKELSLDRKV
jgi:hypothetical protein